MSARCAVCMGPDAEACGCEAAADLTPRQVRARVRKYWTAQEGGHGEQWGAFLMGRVLGLDVGKPNYRGVREPVALIANVRHVSSSGMLRVIDLYTPTGGDIALVRPAWFKTYNLDRKRDGYRVGGCGMDMTFALASSMFEACKRELGIGYRQWPYQLHLPRVHLV